MGTHYAITYDGRTCTSCKLFKTWENYHRNANGANKRESKCKDCRNALRKRKRLEAKRRSPGPDFRRPFTWIRPGVQRGCEQPGTVILGMLEDGFMEAGWVLEQWGQRYAVKQGRHGQRLERLQ